ncbi:ribosome maturation factor RimM [Lederbergia lenta]|uniref:Ribosome maturation factor RimM n=1 Tax=Lederbergia lenta TaxID=1467 RepID=A0A2X4W7T4_LEDLE|nr:ribosome maturation factor RimM [Lederbergia lenta]MCM3110176.1 ribosome maturation factor RimM [Lederbergia lenta]MEC2324256.1 ribosome maturation factor RimM [Lederbergia lenta]SQI60256.1 16S rRNA-processing protein RimM [Lederbergia lenta]
MPEWFNVGKIVNTHGINGEVRVISNTDFAEERYAPKSSLHLFMPGKKEAIPLTVKSHRVHKNFDLLKFEGYENINDVVHWKNSILKVTEEQLSDLPKGEYYFHEIIGCEVVTMDNEVIGSVKEILTPGANDVWVVTRENGKDVLIPYIDEIVMDISIENKKITIKLMEGLIE